MRCRRRLSAHAVDSYLHMYIVEWIFEVPAISLSHSLISLAVSQKFKLADINRDFINKTRTTAMIDEFDKIYCFLLLPIRKLCTKSSNLQMLPSTQRWSSICLSQKHPLQFTGWFSSPAELHRNDVFVLGALFGTDLCSHQLEQFFYTFNALA